MELTAMQRAEKQRLMDEIHRVTEAMDRRHDQERADVEVRIQQEEAALREYELARQRMEDMQRQLEAIKRAPTILSNRPREFIPELDHFQREHQGHGRY
jgi:hypothetical protein